MNVADQLIGLIRPYEVTVEKIRVGNQKGDGGYVLLKPLCEETEFVYSFGIGNDCSFEKDMVERFPNVRRLYMFDPFIDRLPEEHPKFDFIPCDFADGMKYYQPSDGALLKVDVEWGEWPVLAGLDFDRLKQYKQIVIEFHFVLAAPQIGLSPYFRQMYENVFKDYNAVLLETYLKVIGRIVHTHACFHIHANNSLPLIDFFGYKIPPLLEMSFVRRNAIKETDLLDFKKGPFPVEGLDFPNKADRPDIIGYFPFHKNGNGGAKC